MVLRMHGKCHALLTFFVEVTLLLVMNDSQVFDLLFWSPLMDDAGPYAPDDVTKEDHDLQRMSVVTVDRFPFDSFPMQGAGRIL
jgi:hypothetical protein